MMSGVYLSSQLFLLVLGHKHFSITRSQMSLDRASSEQQQLIKIEKISASVNMELVELQTLSKECSIYDVPQRLRKVNENAYTPQVVSIGPIHHGKGTLKPMEDHKRRYLHHFLQLIEERQVNDFVKFISDRETQVRNCYAQSIGLNSEEFVKMILIDAAFIILLLLQGTFPLELTDDRVLGKPKMIYEIRHDMLLLENQLPFFILHELFEFSRMPQLLPSLFNISVRPDLCEGIDLIKITYLFFKRYIDIPNILERNYGAKVEHLLHFLRICYIPSGWHQEREDVQTLGLPSVTELHQAGVKLRPRSTNNLFDISFRDGVLEIPPFEIVDSTEILFRNLCAFEQCHCRTSSVFWDVIHNDSQHEECVCLSGLFGDYLSVMFQLIKSPKDVELLVQQEILVNRAFSSEHVVRFFHKLDIGIITSWSLFCYGNLIRDLNEYHTTRWWPKWKASLRQDYFKNPWTGISVAAATLLLALTIIQTVCSILQVL